MIYNDKEYIIKIGNENYHCVVDLTMHFIGGKWKAIILWYMKDGVKRFGELKKLIPDITERMLTLQLRELEKDGFVLRTMYPQIPPRVEYSLTEQGKSLLPILEEMVNWGINYAKDNGTFEEVKSVQRKKNK